MTLLDTFPPTAQTSARLRLEAPTGPPDNEIRTNGHKIGDLRLIASSEHRRGPIQTDWFGAQPADATHELWSYDGNGYALEVPA